MQRRVSNDSTRACLRQGRGKHREQQRCKKEGHRESEVTNLTHRRIFIDGLVH